MDINQILDSIKEVSNLSEKYFLDLRPRKNFLQLEAPAHQA